MKWIRSGDYDRITRHEYVHQGDPVDARAAAGDAAEHYAERFRGFFKDAGASVEKAGDKAGDAADKLSEWLRDRR
jgi:hypothetical protein